ncbi:MAG: CDP-glucose 4,6-dehydratase [Halioglobus sp.]
MPSASFWKGKRVLLTGHTGFKGSWLAIWLRRLGAEVTGVSLPSVTEPNLFTLASIDSICDSHYCDIRDAGALAKLFRGAKPELVFHMAAQPLVRDSYREPLLTFDTNVMGAAHVLEAMRGLSSIKVAVMVTTDKVYSNLEQLRPYREDDMLGGYDPYSASKAASELVIASYRDAFLAEQGVSVATARAGNVIGGGDWSRDRLIPDALMAWQADSVLEIRRPEAVRPWQHVLDPLAGYLCLAEYLWKNPTGTGAYNFGPQTDAAASVRDVVELARAHFESSQVSYSRYKEGPHEAGLLSLNTKKAQETLGVKPRWNLSESVKHTFDWYCAQLRGSDARKLCVADINAFEGES